MESKTPWEILNVTSEATLAQIKEAYSKLAKENNPEDNPEEFRKIHDAYKFASSIAKLKAKGKTVVVVNPDGTKTTIEAEKSNQNTENSTNNQEDSSQVEDSMSSFDFDAVNELDISEPIEEESDAKNNSMAKDLGDDFKLSDFSSDENGFDFSEVNSDEYTDKGMDPLDFFGKTCYELSLKHPGKPFTDEEIVLIAIKYLRYINSDESFKHNRLIWEQYKHNQLIVDAFTLPIFEDEVNKMGLRYNEAKSLCMCVGGKSKPVFDSTTNTYQVNLDFTSQYYIDTYMSRIHRNVNNPADNTEPVPNDSKKNDINTDVNEVIEEKEAVKKIPEEFFKDLLEERELKNFDPNMKEQDFVFANKVASLLDSVIDYLEYISRNDEFKDNYNCYIDFVNNDLVKYVRRYASFLGKINNRALPEEALKLLAQALGSDFEVGTIPNAPTNRVYIYKKPPVREDADYKRNPNPLALHEEFLHQIQMAKEKSTGTFSDEVKLQIQIVMHYIFIMNRDEIYKRPIAWKQFTNDMIVKETFMMQKFREDIVKIPLHGDFAKMLAEFYHKKCEISYNDKTNECFISIPDNIKAPTLKSTKESKFSFKTKVLIFATIVIALVTITRLLSK